MTQSPGARAPYEPAPLSAEERARAEAAFVPYVTELLATQGRFRTSVDRPEMVDLFQRVARRAGQQLGRPVVSVSNGREITITFGVEADAVGPGGESRPLE
ncbi:MAG TPA: hypothetical protein VH089_10100 [Streptosporangiaceae bacterium]|jgi:hypothetical protein|nr:hypothetical protein [Streptosporangiaceae bacterium]